ncbi:MAG: divalent cation tolerance protein CutA [Bacteroidetes bacterium]|nr:divalent cation tolerance protein CutA [Bacteroidota bacterium]
MILMHISSPNQELLQQVAKLLLKENLVADVRFDDIRRLSLQQENLVMVPRYLLACKTKALLFNTIVEYIREHITQELPEMYALPLVMCEKSQEELIRSRTRAV